MIFIFSDFKFGGSQGIAISVANELFNLNKNVAILTLSDKGGMKKLINNNIKIYNLNTDKLIFSFFLFLNFFNKRNFTKVFCVHPHIAIFCYILNFFLKKKIKIIARETNTYSYNKFRKKKIKELLETSLKKFFYKKLYCVIFSSKKLANEYMCKKKIIPNFVNKKKINSLKIEKIQNFFLNNNKFILGIGRLVKQKRFEDLIIAFSMICEKTNHNLLIIGEGPEKNFLNKLIKDLKLEKRIKIIKFVKNPYKYLNKCDLFVLTSAWEGMPNILIQALFCNANIVSTDCKYGPREILNNGTYGKLIRVGDCKAISKSILKNIKKKKIKIPWNYLKKYETSCTIPQYADILS